MEISDYIKRRFGAAFIDSVMLGAVCVLLHVPMALLIKILPIPSFMNYVWSVFLLLLFGAITLFKDGPIDLPMLPGQSIGKKVFNLKVTKLDGKTPISFRESLARNLPIAVPYFWMSGLWLVQIIPVVGWYLFIGMFILGVFGITGVAGYEAFLVFRDPENRRWGDRQAGSRVVDE